MNYNNDSYIEDKKEREVIEGEPQPNRRMPRAYKAPKHSNDLKDAKRSIMSRGQTGSKQHPRG